MSLHVPLDYNASEYMYVHFTVLSILPKVFYDEKNQEVLSYVCMCVFVYPLIEKKYWHHFQGKKIVLSNGA